MLRKIVIAVALLFPVLLFLHYSDGQIKERTFINYDDLDLIKPMLTKSVSEYFTEWLPDRNNHAYPLRDFTYFADHWLSAKTGIPTYWLTQLLLFAATLVGCGWLFTVAVPGKPVLILSLVALMALHPLNVEIIQWLMNRKHLMGVLFLLFGSALVLERGRRREALTKRDWVWCWALYFASIFSFPTGLLWMPWVLWMQREHLDIRPKLRLAIWSATGMAIALYIRLTTAGEADYGGSIGRLATGEQIDKAFTFAYLSLGRGFWNTIAPFWLAPYYSELSGFTIAGVAALIALTILFFKTVKEKEERRFARDVTVLGLILLAPSALVFIGFPDWVWADRYGFIALPIFLVYLGLMLKNVKSWHGTALVISTAVAAVWTIGAVKITVERVPLWRNAVTLMNECAMKESSPKCIVQTAQRAIHIDGCKSLGPIIEKGLKLYPKRPKHNSEYKSEMPFYHAICIALSANLPPEEKLKKLPYLFDEYEGAGEIMFSIILANLQAKNYEAAYSSAKQYFFSGDPRPLITTRNTVNIYRGAAKALCEVVNQPECEARKNHFLSSNAKTPPDPGYFNWGYNLVRTMAK